MPPTDCHWTDVAEYTPTQFLAICMAVIRGGEAVPVELIEQDVAEWIERYGSPTAESVDQWALESFALGFGLDVLRKRYRITDE